MSFQIDRCLCFQRTFTELKSIAEKHQSKTLPELQQHIQFGEKCKLCHPYIRQMLKTGQSIFHEILTEP